MLSYAKSGTARTGDRLNGFNNGKTQQFNSRGVVIKKKIKKKRITDTDITARTEL